jgi:hypothetical protein
LLESMTCELPLTKSILNFYKPPPTWEHFVIAEN